MTLSSSIPFFELENLNDEPFEGYEAALDEYMREMNEQEAARQKRRQRLNDCGKFGYYFDPHTGKKTGYIMSCDLFRECPTCRKKRAEQEGEWLREAFYKNKNGMQFVLADDKDVADKLLRSIHKTKYVRYPQQDGTEYIFVDGSIQDVDGDNVSPEFLRLIDWETVVVTPAGRNKSGTMHVPQSPKNPENFQIIEIEQFIPDAPTEAIDRAMDYAIAQTLELLPETAKEVEEAINQRVALSIQYLRDQGYYVRTYSKKIKVIKSQINWSKFALVNNLNTENSTREYAGSP